MSLPGRKRYCVFGCTHLGAYMHSFPHPQRRSEMFQKWVSIVGDKLKESDPWRIYKNKKVCDYHFTLDQKVACHRLIINAVPSVILNGVFSSTGVLVQLEHNYCFPRAYESSSSSNPLNPPEITTDEALNTHLNRNDQPSTSHANEMYTDLKSSEFIHKKYKTAQKEMRKLKTQLRKSKKREKSFEARLASANKILQGSNVIDRVTQNMTPAAKIFTGMQYRQGLKKPKGRRYLTQEKVMALSIYKKSPKCYTLLSKYFKLPSAKSLKNLLSDIKIAPGINKVIFEKIKETVGGINEEDRLCTLIFDEMSLSPHIQYNSGSDELKGFCDYYHYYGTNQSNQLKIANHALVFMVKGIKKNFKQPVAYYFTQSLKTIELKNIIKEVVRHVNRTGLKILCVVCDQGKSNVTAINSLVEDTKKKYLRKGKDWRHEFFEVEGHKIIPLYDVPHLLKGLQNNLLSKDLKYTDFGDDNKEKIAKWQYFEMLYEADKTCGELRYLHKLTEEHVKPAKIKKMRVKMAAQIFSHSVAVTTEHLTARKILPEECRQLIPLVLIIDKLFDSLNAGTFHIPNGKIYRGAVKINSPHHKLWLEAIKFLKSIKFIVKKKVGDKMRLIETSVPSVKNFIKTIEGMQALWKILNQKYSLDCMLTRNFNQDPVENFFGNVRSLGVRNVSPNCHSFEGAFKTLLLNNYSCQQAVNANCEEDFNACLQTLEFFLKEKDKVKITVQETQIDISESLYEALSNVPTGDSSFETQKQYVCGWVLTKCLKKIVKNCKECRATLLSHQDNKGNEYIRAKEYDKNKKWLCYPSNELVNCFREIQNITLTFLKTNLKKQKVKENITLLTNSFVSFPLNCTRHKESLQNYFTDTTIKILIFSWCRSVNRILSGKITNLDVDDPVKRSAQIYFNTHKNVKK